VASPLVARLAAAGVAVEEAPADARVGPGALRLPDHGDAWLAPSDGRTATARAVAAGVRDLVVFDLALDHAKATRLAIAAADGCGTEAAAAAAGALQAVGLAVSRIDDVPGLVVLRTVAMLANEAAEALVQGVGDAAAIDLAMLKGVNYPRGPLAWADALGAATVRDVLARLAAHYGDGRYRVSSLIARRALTGGTLHG
jgi:3-hydroxybutyryl-CoA dehydrogenase